MDTEISPLELALQKRLSKLKPKTQTPGFLRSVVERQSLRIESALGMGYSYDEIAEIFSEQGFKCKGSTLKKYHLQARKLLDDKNSSPIPELPEKKEASQSRPKKS